MTADQLMDTREIELYAKALAPVLHQHILRMIAPLEQRIRDLEQAAAKNKPLKHCGPWKAGTQYTEGCTVDHLGKRWIARAFNSNQRPDKAPGLWDKTGGAQ